MVRGLIALAPCLLSVSCNELFSFDEAAPLADVAALPSCDTGWRYRVPVLIENAAGRKLTDHQLAIRFDTASAMLAGKLRSDAGDLRLTVGDGSVNLRFLIERDLGTTGTLIWTRVPFIPAGPSYIWLHYGNPIDEGDGDLQTDVFVPGIIENPSFESGGGWILDPLPVGVSLASIQLPGNHSQFSFGGGDQTLSVLLEQHTPRANAARLVVSQRLEIPPDTDVVVRFDVRVHALGGDGNGAVLAWTSSRSAQPIWRLTQEHGNATGVRVGEETKPLTPGLVTLALVASIDDRTGYVRADFDHLRVRKHVSPEPTVTIGAEESPCD